MREKGRKEGGTEKEGHEEDEVCRAKRDERMERREEKRRKVRRQERK